MAKKVLFIANEYTTLINFRMELVKAVVATGYKVGVALPPHERVKEIEDLGCSFYPLKVCRRSTNPIKDIFLIKNVSKILKEFQPDIVFTFTIKPNVYGGISCSYMNIPYVATITGLGSSIENGGIMRRISLVLYKWGLKKAKIVFFQNQGNMRLFSNEKVYLGKNDLLPGSGVNVERFKLMDYPSDDTINIAFVGRVMKEKGVEELFDAAEFIKAKYPNTTFHICGPCEEAYEDRLNRLQQAGIIKYHGTIKDMVPVYKKVHCVVLPSYHEGMANVLLESAACGRPIIASDIYGCREAIEDGVNGFLIESRNVESLKFALEKFVKLQCNEKRKMGIAGRQKMEKEFDRKIVVNKYLKIIETV